MLLLFHETESRLIPLLLHLDVKRLSVEDLGAHYKI